MEVDKIDRVRLAFETDTVVAGRPVGRSVQRRDEISSWQIDWRVGTHLRNTLEAASVDVVTDWFRVLVGAEEGRLAALWSWNGYLLVPITSKDNIAGGLDVSCWFSPLN